MEDRSELWQRFCRYRVADTALGFSLDVSRVRFDEAFLEEMQPVVTRALQSMRELEEGGIANRDENRMVGHYWLRDPGAAPTTEIAAAIREATASVRSFASEIRSGSLSGSSGPFRQGIHIGIGGSALGPQFLSEALGGGRDAMPLHFIDNTDPDGFDRAREVLGDDPGRCLVSVVSKSGSTPEPRNAMLEVRAAYERAGVDFARHAVAITTPGSRLDAMAAGEGWLRRFPMWDWVGGRTSVTSAVGLLPAALAGIDIDGFLAGAAAMDALTRKEEMKLNPAAMLALMWYHVGGGRGRKDMVILPYKDRLATFGRYLQQLVMESLGKEKARDGAVKPQGIAVYGNKGSTDQHAYVQQLRDGIDNFFVTFIQVLRDRAGPPVEVEPGTTSGDYLCGFLLGTREALHENGRESITITLDQVSPDRIGGLIALYERTVGLYAELINVNAYDQPGVEAGKKAAAGVLELQGLVLDAIRRETSPRTADEIATAIGRPEEAETVFKILEHLAGNTERSVGMRAAASPDRVTFVAE